MKFLQRYKKDIEEISTGFYRLRDNFIDLSVINIEEITLEGYDGIFLSAFCKNMERIYSPANIKNLPQDKKVLDSLVKILNSRLYLFEGTKHGC